MKEEIRNHFTKQRKEELIRIFEAIIAVTKAEIPGDNTLQMNLFDDTDHLYLAIYNAVWKIKTDPFDAFYTMQYIDRFFSRHEWYVNRLPF
jgi:hypothetical protein